MDGASLGRKHDMNAGLIVSSALYILPAPAAGAHGNFSSIPVAGATG
jgi:hypothetical protein